MIGLFNPSASLRASTAAGSRFTNSVGFVIAVTGSPGVRLMKTKSSSVIPMISTGISSKRRIRYWRIGSCPLLLLFDPDFFELPVVEIGLVREVVRHEAMHALVRSPDIRTAHDDQTQTLLGHRLLQFPEDRLILVLRMLAHRLRPEILEFGRVIPGGNVAGAAWI